MAHEFNEIQVEMLETAGLASDDARFPEGTLDRIVNRAIQRISAIHDWPWLQTSETINTVASTQAYTPTAGWSKTIRLRYKNRDLVEYQPRDAIKYQNDTGTPVGFFIEEEQIHFVPIPDGAYTIEHVYLRREPQLVADDDEPLIPERYMDFVVWHAVMLCASRIHDMDLYSRAREEARQWETRIRDDVRRSTGTLKVQARDDWWI